MVNEYKILVLLKGLERISNYHFSMFKSLMASELKLTKKMQDDYDKIQIADLMEELFPNDAGLNRLIEVFGEMPGLEQCSENLKKEMLKVVRRSKSTPAKGKSSAKKKNKKKEASAMPTSTSSTVEDTPKAQKRKSTNNEKTAKKKKVSEKQVQPSCSAEAGISTAMGLCSPLPVSSSTLFGASPAEKTLPQPQIDDRRNVLCKDPLAVMVLKTTDVFEYEPSEGEKSEMFHALVATEKRFFRVKVLDVSLKEKFTINSVITISNYFECVGDLEINKSSSVSATALTQKFVIPKWVSKKANETPKIDHIHKEASGTNVYGLFTLKKKKENMKRTVYQIQDKTGQIDVICTGKWRDLDCKEGDKFQLYCFQVRRINKQPTLMCGCYSYIKVIKSSRKRRSQPMSV
ncbi:gamma-interferon-inducible protein 16-like isoform X1 [Octodon degus]|uniref:Gamma-interferon-inducible protein 16-like isoform X1 n=1 Tax=Octodon degus TaxID=10160 RepID=A0A6P6D6D9_OCTDE|nr:gamma-interferon-inducible protein 16-like isoform X1 [Octodon degus]